MRNDNGTPLAFDDTWGYTVTVTGQYTGTGWTSDNSSLVSGTYTTPVIVTGLPVATPSETIVFADNADANCTATVTVSVPRIIGTVNFGTARPLFTDATAVPAAWTVDESAPTQTMNNGGGAPAKVYRSEIIDLSTTGIVKFTGSLLVNDTSSGNEAGDTFKAELIITNGGTTTVNLIAPYDTLAPPNGLMNGGDTAANDEFNAAKLQDGDYISDFPLAFTIPDSATSVQLVISGTNDSLSEAWVLENCLFATASATASNDTDGDGISNTDEALMGTDPNDATSFTRLAQTEGLPTEFSFAGADNRFYRIYQSDDTNLPSHLATWIDTGLAASGAGSHTLNVTVAPGVRRRLYRVHVMQTDGPWPARTP